MMKLTYESERIIAACANLLLGLEPDNRAEALAALCDFYVKTNGTFKVGKA
jgi:hypothetical protein